MSEFTTILFNHTSEFNISSNQSYNVEFAVVNKSSICHMLVDHLMLHSTIPLDNEK